MNWTRTFFVALLSLSSAHVAHAATFSVNTPVDGIDARPGDGRCSTTSGACTLRAAIMEANALAGSHTITLPAGTYTLTIFGRDDDSGKTGDLDIRSNVVIVTIGGIATIQGGAGWDDRIFEIGAGVTVVMKGLHIRFGSESSLGTNFGGGGILNRGTLALSGSQVTENRTHFDGGGIVNYFGGTLNLDGVQVVNNISSRGGGITNWAVMSAADSTIQNNKATSSLFGGGGIYNGSSDSNLTLTNVAVVSNSTALSPGTGGGGGILNEGTINATKSEISSNRAAIGGGIFDSSGLTTVTLTDSGVSNNVADAGDPDSIAFAGGGIFHGGGQLTLVRTIVSGNSAPGSLAGGGGIYNFNGAATLTDSTVTGNTAYGGGGIINSGLSLTLNRSTVSLNSATFGGGLWNASGSTGHPLTITNSTVSGNTAVEDGGGVAHTGPATVTLANVTITRNAVLSPDFGGGGILVIGSSISLGNSIVAGNTSSVGPDCRTVSTSDPAQIVSQGFNVIFHPSGCVISGNTANNAIGLDPRLGPLQDNGGPTATHALLAGSPVIDRSGSVCPAEDQRGATRPADGDGNGTSFCDSGAFEVDPDFLGFATLEPATARVTVHDRLTYRLTWTVPPALGGWRAALNSLELRIRDHEGIVFWLHFEESDGTFSLIDGSGSPGVPGTSGELHTPFATLYLKDSAVDGPPGQRVTLTVALSFKPRAGDRQYVAEVLATGGGHQQGFDKKASLIVVRRD